MIRDWLVALASLLVVLAVGILSVDSRHPWLSDIVVIACLISAAAIGESLARRIEAARKVRKIEMEGRDYERLHARESRPTIARPDPIRTTHPQ